LSNDANDFCNSAWATGLRDTSSSWETLWFSAKYFAAHFNIFGGLLENISQISLRKLENSLFARSLAYLKA
jgi:hypothetical protein